MKTNQQIVDYINKLDRLLKKNYINERTKSTATFYCKKITNNIKDEQFIFNKGTQLRLIYVLFKTHKIYNETLFLNISKKFIDKSFINYINTYINLQNMDNVNVKTIEYLTLIKALLGASENKITVNILAYFQIKNWCKIKTINLKTINTHMHYLNFLSSSLCINESSDSELLVTSFDCLLSNFRAIYNNEYWKNTDFSKIKKEVKSFLRISNLCYHNINSYNYTKYKKFILEISIVNKNVKKYIEKFDLIHSRLNKGNQEKNFTDADRVKFDFFLITHENLQHMITFEIFQKLSLQSICILDRKYFQKTDKVLQHSNIYIPDKVTISLIKFDLKVRKFFKSVITLENVPQQNLSQTNDLLRKPDKFLFNCLCLISNKVMVYKMPSSKHVTPFRIVQVKVNSFCLNINNISEIDLILIEQFNCPISIGEAINNCLLYFEINSYDEEQRVRRHLIFCVRKLLFDNTIGCTIEK